MIKALFRKEFLEESVNSKSRFYQTSIIIILILFILYYQLILFLNRSEFSKMQLIKIK